MTITKTTSLMLLSGVATALLIGQASALEAQAFVDRVASVYKAVGYEMKFGPATLDGDSVIVDGVTVTVIDAAMGMEPMVLDTELTFSGITEWDDDSYTVDSLIVPDVDAEFGTETAGHITVSDIRADGLYFPAGDTVSIIDTLQLVESISTGPLLLTRNGQQVLSVEFMEATSTFTPEQGSADLTDVNSTLTIGGIQADLTSVAEEDPAAGAIISALGLTSISGNITQDTTWSLSDGHLAVNEFLFDFADVGALNITAEVTGVTPAVLEQVATMQSQMGGAEMTQEQSQAQMMSGMALMQGVNIVGASVRYDDASLAGKLLDFFASQSGADRATFVAGLKGMLPAIIGESGIPALNDLVVPPVSAFLDDPQSLEARAAPPSPTSLLVLMAAAANPAGLITALGLTVTANTPTAE